MPVTEQDKQRIDDQLSKMREAMAKMSEQISGAREDIGEMKTSLKTATDIMANLHRDYVPRAEIEKQIEIRERAEAEQDRQIEALWKRYEELPALVDKKFSEFAKERVRPVENDVKKLNAKSNWLGGLGTAAVVILGLLEAWLKGGKG